MKWVKKVATKHKSPAINVWTRKKHAILKVQVWYPPKDYNKHDQARKNVHQCPKCMTQVQHKTAHDSNARRKQKIISRQAKCQEMNNSKNMFGYL